MSRHGSFNLTRGPNKGTVRRPNLPGVRRRSIGQGLGDRRRIPPGLESFVGAAGLEPAGASQRGGPPRQGIGADDPTRGLGQLGPDTGGTLIGDSFGTISAPSTAGLGGPGGPTFSPPPGPTAAESFASSQAFFASLPPTEGRPATVPDFGPNATFQQKAFADSLQGSVVSRGGAIQDQRLTSGPFAGQFQSDLGRRAQAETQKTTGRLGNPLFVGAPDRPPVPFQSFDDFFAAQRLQERFRADTQAAGPRRNALTPEQARLRAAGEPFTDSTGALRQPGSQLAGTEAVPGGGQTAGGTIPGGVPGAAPPGFGSGGSQREDLGGGAGAGLNVGLIEQQALFAALREQFMRALIPQLAGGLR